MAVFNNNVLLLVITKRFVLMETFQNTKNRAHRLRISQWSESDTKRLQARNNEQEQASGHV